MNARTHREVVDELARLAAVAEPPALDELAAHRLVERAIANAPAPPASHRSIAWLPALVAVGCLVAWLVLRGGPVPATPPPSTVALPTGDRLTALAGARYDVDRLEPADRRLHLLAGTILADVAHVAPDQRFQIATAHLVATATGTVFSVETDATRSRVAVYDGTVVVEQAGAQHVLVTGTGWDSASGIVAPARVAELAPAVTVALAHRDAGLPPAKIVAAPPPPVDDGGSATAAPPPERAKPAPLPSLEALLARTRAQIAAGEFAPALATAKLAASRGAASGAWRLVTADALRGLDRPADAARELDAAHRELTGLDAAEAAYSAAYLRFRELHDAAGALASLTDDIDAAGSPLEERGLGLRVRIVEALGRHDQAKQLAERYLERFPRGDLGAFMRAIAR